MIVIPGGVHSALATLFLVFNQDSINGADIDVFMTQIVVENRGFVTKGLSIPYADLKTFPSIDVGIGAVNITKVIIICTSVPHVVPQSLPRRYPVCNKHACNPQIVFQARGVS